MTVPIADPLSPPWAASEWWGEAEEWITERVRYLGGQARIIGAPERIKVWSISCLLRVSTTHGVCYFKAVPRLFGNEASITQKLAGRYPSHIPDVVAVEHDPGRDRYWMLMREFVGPPLEEVRTIEAWADSMRVFAGMQVDCIARTDSLIAWGCAKRPLSGLPDETATLLEELNDPEKRALYGVTDGEAAALQGRSEQINRACAELAACGMPETVVHGDLHGGNVRAPDADTGRAPLFFDWTDAAVSHPFFDLQTILQQKWIAEDPLVREHLLGAYLGGWETHLSRERLQEAFRASERVAPLYHAVSYRNITRALHPTVQGELAGGTGQFLRALLKGYS